MKQLLIDTIPFQFTRQQIAESIRKNSGRLIVSGKLQAAETPNQNGRIYPRPILEREVDKYMKNEVAQRRALGELDHPESSVVNLRNVSHNVLTCNWKGNELWGDVEVLNTPAGNILKELFKANITLGISSRGMGSVTQLDESTVEVDNDFQLVAWDFVSNPSTHGAFMTPTMGEGLNESVLIQKPTAYVHADKVITEIICELSGVCCIN